jgi:SAM-dependent MidA family methyltransferase
LQSLDLAGQEQEVKRLTMPDAMGEMFKVIAFSRGLDLDLIGFSLHSELHYL